MLRIRRFFHRIIDTAHYLRLWLAAPPSARFIPAAMLAKAPICWVRGHSWEHGPSIGISAWRAEFCTCCGQEIAFRISLDQLRSPETDEERDMADWDREQFSEDDFRDADGAFTDWDAMHDHATQHGGPF